MKTTIYLILQIKVYLYYIIINTLQLAEKKPRNINICEHNIMYTS